MTINTLPKEKLIPGTLYIVSTPIGHLNDITLRAIQLLSNVDLIACEDTRVTQHLAKHFGFSTPMISCHDHNEHSRLEGIVQRLTDGQTIALVSDAGTPLISDPGFPLVNAVLDAGFSVVPIPGASAVMTALSASGLPPHPFFFGGFLPQGRSAKASALRELKQLNATLIFFEGPSRLLSTLEVAQEVLGDRPAVVGRELTKYFETFYRGTISTLIPQFPTPPKGEAVILFGPPVEKEPLDLDQILLSLLADHSLSDTVEKAVEYSGGSKRQVYQRALEIKKTMDATANDDSSFED